MKRLFAFAAIVLALSCKTTEGTTSPDDTSALEGMEKSPSGTTPEGGAAPAVDPDEAAKKAAAEKVLAKVHDRDPEEEKRKLAQSRQRSAQARKMLEGGRFEEAVSNSRAALKIHEQNVDAMLVLAEVYYREKKYELTVSVTGTALAVDEKIRTPKETSIAYNLQGFAFASMGQNTRATKAFKKAAEADDKNAAAWNNLGTRYLRGGDTKTAAECFAYAIELKPSFAKAHLNYGAALRGLGKIVEAEKEFQQALKLKKTYPEAYFNLGVLYLDADPYPELDTVQRLNKAILYFEKYKGLATDISTEPVPKGIGNKKDLAPVSRARADDYIRLAQKGLDRENRAKQREAERGAKAATGGSDKEDTGEAGDAAEGEAAPADASPKKPGGATPTKPGEPMKPGGSKPATPTKPGASEPATPTKPGASEPATKSAKPAAPSQPIAPTKPGSVAPTKPGASAPTKPSTTTPTPTKPGAVTPTKPGTVAPTKPGAGTTAPAKPSAPTTKPDAAPPPKPPASPPPSSPPTAAPQKPGVQKPGAAPPSTPTKPGVQKPGQKSAAAWNPRKASDSKQDGATASLARLVPERLDNRAWRSNVQAVSREHT